MKAVHQSAGVASECTAKTNPCGAGKRPEASPAGLAEVRAMGWGVHAKSLSDSKAVIRDSCHHYAQAIAICQRCPAIPSFSASHKRFRAHNDAPRYEGLGTDPRHFPGDDVL